MGLDKKLYAVRGATPQSEIQKLDPDTLQKLGPALTARDQFGNRIHIAGIAAAENGDIFASQRLGWVYHYNSQMQLLNYRYFDISGFDASSLKINSSGMIVMGGRNGEIVVTDTSLQTKLFFRSARRETYASFIVPRIPASPEPAVGQLIAMAMIGSPFIGYRGRCR